MTDTLADLLSQDSHRIWAASWEVIRTRDVALLETLRAALPQIREATAHVELGGMIRPNSDALQHALGKVRGTAPGSAGATTTRACSHTTRTAKKRAST